MICRQVGVIIGDIINAEGGANRARCVGALTVVVLVLYGHLLKMLQFVLVLRGACFLAGIQQLLGRIGVRVVQAIVGQAVVVQQLKV